MMNFIMNFIAGCIVVGIIILCFVFWESVKKQDINILKYYLIVHK